MRAHDYQAISRELDLLEQELKQLSLWGGEHKRPDPEALNSNSPFCIDTLEFNEWLEYIMIERFRQMIAANMHLPEKMQVHTYAQERYRGEWSKYRKLIGHLQNLDRLISISDE